MSDGTHIEWTDATLNFWWGCTKVGPLCDNCYAETWAIRTGHHVFGHGVPRRKIKGARALILKLQNAASWFYADNDRLQRVFIQSMSDLFDVEVPTEWLAEAWGLIELCDSLEIQIVTKRVSVIEKRLAAIGVINWPKHAGLIISVGTQAEADRDIPRLIALKRKLGIPWVGLSMEPLLGPVDISAFLPRVHHHPDNQDRNSPAMQQIIKAARDQLDGGIDWVIVGGESGPGARPMDEEWARSLLDQCRAAGVPFFCKQLSIPGSSKALKDLGAFPADLRVRDYPDAR